MTQEHKDLLFKDLCARLPYGVKISRVVEDWISDPHLIRSIRLNNIIVEDGEFEDGTPDIDVWDYEDIKPYLFPLSSMTEEQKSECFKGTPLEIDKYGDIAVKDNLYGGSQYTDLEIYLGVIGWLLKNHFDIYGLIEKGLAIDCTNLNIY